MDIPAVRKTNRKEQIIIIICLLIGCALRYYTFDRKSLWLDEIYTYNEMKFGFRDQLTFYQEKPYFIQAPLFFILTNLFHPTTKPERDLRIIPLIFGTLSIPMIYLLVRLFSPTIALPCALSLTFMVYHISISQEGRSYSMLMFLAMVAVYFLMKYLKSSRKRYLFPGAFSYAIMFHLSYSSIPFLIFSQLLWFYQIREDNTKPKLSLFLIFNGMILFFCLPWVLFLLLNYKGQSIMGPPLPQELGSFWNTIFGVFHDWMPNIPLIALSAVALILFPLLSNTRNALVLWAMFILPVGMLHVYCRVLHIHNFITSRYFISFLPLFWIMLFLSINAIQTRVHASKTYSRFTTFFLILIIASNALMLPAYYRSEKQDFKGLVRYLKNHLNDGDIIIASSETYILGMLHYFGVYPADHFYMLPTRTVSGNEREQLVSLLLGNRKITIEHSNTYWNTYFTEGNRLWIVVHKNAMKEIQKVPSIILKGYFDGSFLNFDRFPTDASMYLFLWDPKSPHEKGIDMPME
jgi:hypothetical protein